jgi:hypothetical protein
MHIPQKSHIVTALALPLLQNFHYFSQGRGTQIGQFAGFLDAGFPCFELPSMKMVCIPRVRPNSISESESPIITLAPAVTSGNSATTCSNSPGIGFLTIDCYLVPLTH